MCLLVQHLLYIRLYTVILSFILYLQLVHVEEVIPGVVLLFEVFAEPNRPVDDPPLLTADKTIVSNIMLSFGRFIPQLWKRINNYTRD